MGREPTGSVYQDKKSGGWRVQFTIGKRRWSQRVRPIRGREVTKRQAETVRDVLLDRIRNGWDPFAPPEIAPTTGSVAEYIREWIKRQSYSTKRSDQRKVERYIAPSAFGRMPLANVRPMHVAAFIEHAAALPSKRGDKLAPRTVRNIYSIVQRALARATVDEVFSVNPCDSVAKAGMLPTITDKKPGDRQSWTYTRTEVETLISDPRIPLDRRVLYAILFLSGARFGEAAALRWRDWNDATKPLGRITIALSVHSETRELKATKTGAVRLVPVHPLLAEILTEWRETGFAATFGNPPFAGDWIVPNKLGRARAVSAAHQAMASDCKRVGVPTRGMQQHGMRHTFVSLARSDGARGDLLRWVTHTPPKSMLDQYTTPEWEALCGEVAKLRIARPTHAADST